MAMPPDPGKGGQWKALATLSSLSEEEATTVEIDGHEIALFRRGAAVYALDSICPHRGAALAEGTINGDEVACPWHGWRFELATGKCRTLPTEAARTFAVRIAGDSVEVFVPSPADVSGPRGDCPRGERPV
jgi:NAD(P)H-dependent nitrite reductase small subunit